MKFTKVRTLYTLCYITVLGFAFVAEYEAETLTIKTNFKMNTEDKNKGLTSNDAKPMLDAVNQEVEKELACWIYYEDSHTFYCYDCVQKRVDEINTNKEFAEDINYEGGDTCGYMQDVADTGGEYEAECETCHKPLYTIGFPD